MGIIQPISISFAFETLESLLLGDKNQDKSETKSQNSFDQLLVEETDKLSNLKNDKNDQKYLDKKLMRIYYGYYRQGKDLQNYCTSPLSTPVIFNSYQNYIKFKGSVMATLQYTGLDLMVNSLAHYAHFFSVNEEDFKKFSENIVNLYCSKNLSVISLKQLKLNLNGQYLKVKELLEKVNVDDSNQRDFLPHLPEGEFFPKSLKESLDPRQSKRHELTLTLKLFRNLCSWGADPDELDLLGGLIKNPLIYSHLIRQLNSDLLTWDRETDTIGYSKSKLKTHQILCENFICRKVEYDNFVLSMPKPLGSHSLVDDLKRFYCQEFQNPKLETESLEPMKSWLEEQRMNPHQDNILVAQYFSLLSGISDFFIGQKTFGDSKKILIQNVEWNVENWAQNILSEVKNNFYFEEKVVLEKVPRSQYFIPSQGNLEIILEINHGEWDRMYHEIFKPEVVFNFQLENSLLRWLQKTLNEKGLRSLSEDQLVTEQMNKILKAQLSKQIKKLGEKFNFIPWNKDEDFSDLVTKEIFEQLSELPKSHHFFPLGQKKIIPLKIRYGAFSLKYFHQLHKSSLP